MRRFIQLLLVATIVLVMILGLFQWAGGSAPMAKDPGEETRVGWNGKPGVEPKVGWNGKESGFIFMGGGFEPNVGWNGKPAADIVVPSEVAYYDGYIMRPMVGWNG